MPVRDSLQRTSGPSEEALKQELLLEMQSPKASGEPDIVIQGKAPAGTHLFVIWTKWSGFEQVVRSRVILDAYAEWKGEAEALKVTISMGLTPDEAEKLGVS